MNPRLVLLPSLLLGALLACGGGNSTPPPPPGPVAATSLAYTDPTTGTYQLRRNASLSTATHLVLDLVGPAGATASGVSVTFVLSGTAASWKNVAAADAAGTYVANGAAFDLGAGTPILKAKLTGTTLVATVAEKGVAAPKALDKALLRVAVDLASGTTAGATATLTPDAAACKVLLPDGTLSTIAVAASPITAK